MHVRAVTADPGLGVLEDASVVVRGGSIEAVGPAGEIAVPAGARVVEGRGRTLLPGLVDLHVHLFGSGARFDLPVAVAPELALEATLACGVTAVLDLNAPEAAILALRERERSGALAVAPRIFAAGAAIAAPGGHGGEGGFPCRFAGGPEAAAPLVAELAAAGVDAVKIMCESGGFADVPALPALAPSAVEALVAAAHARGLKAVVHAVSVADARTALQAGADALAHLPLAGDWDPELAPLALAVRAAVMPTLAAFEATFRAGIDPAFLDRDLSGFVPAAVGAGFRDAAIRADREASPRAAWFRSRFDAALERVRILREAGVPILPGSDAGTEGAFHGVALHAELEALAASGMAPAEVLVAATAGAARFLGQEDRFGRIAPGLAADLLLVDGNPLLRIGDTRRIVAVYRAGAELDREAVSARLLAVAAPVPATAASESASAVLFDFESADGALPPHVVVTDGERGGRSTAAADLVLEVVSPGRPRFLRVAGVVEFAPPSGGFAGIALSVAPGGSADWTRYRALRFRARADGDRELRVLVRTAAVRDYDDFGASFAAGPEWATFEVPFASLRQVGFGKRVALDLAAATDVEFMTSPGQEGAFRFDVDDVGLVP